MMMMMMRDGTAALSLSEIYSCGDSRPNGAELLLYVSSHWSTLRLALGAYDSFAASPRLLC